METHSHLCGPHKNLLTHLISSRFHPRVWQRDNFKTLNCCNICVFSLFSCLCASKCRCLLLTFEGLLRPIDKLVTTLQPPTISQWINYLTRNVFSATSANSMRKIASLRATLLPLTEDDVINKTSVCLCFRLPYFVNYVAYLWLLCACGFVNYRLRLGLPLFIRTSVRLFWSCTSDGESNFGNRIFHNNNNTLLLSATGETPPTVRAHRQQQITTTICLANGTNGNFRSVC